MGLEKRNIVLLGRAISEVLVICDCWREFFFF